MAEHEDKVVSQAGDCYSTQLIDANGEFNLTALHNFTTSVKLSGCGLSYAVVAIMGPQSSGKSALLNHLFHTNFREMDAYRGRSQTTKGIWIAKAVGIEPTTIVMDLEGTDGRERGEEDTTFEKQSALFALAIADIVLINMWCHDIGREQAANKPLLKTVFQVMMRLFTPRKTTLLFVIRDKTKTPFELLEPVLREDIHKIWGTVTKPQEHKNTPLSEFFNVEVTALSSYEEKEEQFKQEVAQLRQQFLHSISPGGLAGDRQGVIPASAFVFSAQEIWKVIKENKDLDLPAHKIMVATVRCEEIANEKFSQLTSDKEWLDLEQAVRAQAVPGFGKRLSSILDLYLSEYDSETFYFEETVKNAKREQLLLKVLQLIYPAYLSILGHLCTNLLESFKNRLKVSLSHGEGFAASVRICTQSCMVELDQGCSDAAIKQANFDAAKVREKLCRDIDAYVSSIRGEKLSKLMNDFEKRLTDALTDPVISLFETGGKDMWASVRKLLKRETNATIVDFGTAVTGFELDQATFDKMVQNLKDYAIYMIHKKAREEAGKVLIRMKDRFAMVFSHDSDSMPRVWTGKEDIREITKEARSESLKLLARMAAIRLDENPDQIENILFSALMDSAVATSSRGKRLEVSEDPLASSTWEEVPLENTLITPMQCKSLWRRFKVETEYTVTQAISVQEAYKRANNWLPPPWAILAMIVLGFNEFMLLLRNPLYLLILFVLFLLGKAIWVEIDIPGEFRHGVMAGLIYLSTRLLPTFMNLLKRIADEAYAQPTQEAPRPAQILTSRSERSPPTAASSSISGSSPSISSNISTETGSQPSELTHRRSRNTGEEFS